MPSLAMALRLFFSERLCLPLPGCPSSSKQQEGPQERSGCMEHTTHLHGVCLPLARRPILPKQHEGATRKRWVRGTAKTSAWGLLAVCQVAHAASMTTAQKGAAQIPTAMGKDAAKAHARWPRRWLMCSYCHGSPCIPSHAQQRVQCQTTMRVPMPCTLIMQVAHAHTHHPDRARRPCPPPRSPQPPACHAMRAMHACLNERRTREGKPRCAGRRH